MYYFNFYVNKKIEYNSPSLSFRMPQDCKFALSNSYDKAVFNKSKVENDKIATKKKIKPLLFLIS